MVPDTTNLEELLSTLPLEGEIIPTTGIGFGVIVKFRTFYLKVYSDGRNNAYTVNGYTYGKEKPVCTLTVPHEQFSAFACQVTEDDYLRRPFRITWSQP